MPLLLPAEPDLEEGVPEGAGVLEEPEESEPEEAASCETEVSAEEAGAVPETAPELQAESAAHSARIRGSRESLFFSFTGLSFLCADHMARIYCLKKSMASVIRRVRYLFW